MPVRDSEVTGEEAAETAEEAAEDVEVFLPEFVAGRRTVFATEDAGVFRIEDSELQSGAPALGYRRTMCDEDRAGAGCGAAWGSLVCGVMEDGGRGEDDRWLRVRVPAAEATAASDADAQRPQAATPQMPSMKLSQIAPMVVMLGLQKINLEELGLVRHVEVAFVVVQLLCLAVQCWVYSRLSAKPDTGKKLRIPEVRQMGQVVAPAMLQSPKDYDLGKWKEGAKQALMSGVITGGIYYKWEYLMPLVLQVLMTPLQLYESPLFTAHALGRHVDRPFAAPNPFGMPGAPEPPAEEVEDDADEDKKTK